MDSRNEIMKELNELSTTVAGIGSQNPYKVPEGYWDTLASGVLAQIHLQQAKNRPTYTTPPGYFNHLAANVLGKITGTTATETETIQNELEQHAPLLGTLNKKMPYAVPEGYFEQFRVTVPLQPSAVVVPLHKKAREWFAYLSAAVVAGIMIAGAYMLADNSGTYNSIKNIDVKEGVARLSEDEIVNYLDTHPNSNPDIVSPREEEETDLQNSISNMSEDEIQQYLQENNEPGELPLKGI